MQGFENHVVRIGFFCINAYFPARPGPVLITEDPADDMFLRCADAGRAKYILSGDRHLLNLKIYRRIKILSPAGFLSGVTS